MDGRLPSAAGRNATGLPSTFVCGFTKSTLDGAYVQTSRISTPRLSASSRIFCPNRHIIMMSDESLDPIFADLKFLLPARSVKKSLFPCYHMHRTACDAFDKRFPPPRPRWIKDRSVQPYRAPGPFPSLLCVTDDQCLHLMFSPSGTALLLFFQHSFFI